MVSHRETGSCSCCLHSAGRTGRQSLSWTWSMCCRSLNQPEIWGTVYLRIHVQSAHCETKHRSGGLAGDHWGPQTPGSPGSPLWKPPVLADCHTCLDQVQQWIDDLQVIKQTLEDKQYRRIICHVWSISDLIFLKNSLVLYHSSNPTLNKFCFLSGFNKCCFGHY